MMVDISLRASTYESVSGRIAQVKFVSVVDFREEKEVATVNCYNEDPWERDVLGDHVQGRLRDVLVRVFGEDDVSSRTVRSGDVLSKIIVPFDEYFGQDKHPIYTALEDAQYLLAGLAKRVEEVNPDSCSIGIAPEINRDQLGILVHLMDGRYNGPCFGKLSF
jgi:hypothetical protein